MNDGIQVGEGGRKSKLPRWRFVVGLVAVIVLALAAGVFVRWTVDRKNQPIRAPEPLAAEVQDAQTLALAGKQEEADKKIEEGLQSSTASPETKFLLYSQQGSNYYTKGDYQKALDSYTSASKIRDTFAIAQAMAATWEKLGDNQKAIEYLRRAIEIMPEDNPVRDDDIQQIEDQIKSLESRT